jgi:hypothetical protein
MRLLFLLILAIFSASRLTAQILPDRFVIYDPLGMHRHDTAGFSFMTGTNFYGEFVRYSNGSGSSHRWNAKSGGFAEFARWDSTASIYMIGTTEVVIDPLNDISFNPRAIFWEEGVMASFRLAHEAALQFGYIHRCKHDIDNLSFDPQVASEQRTLIYSGIVARALWRPRVLVSEPFELRGGFTVRNDFFMHLLDDRPTSQEARDAGGSMERLINSTNVSGRLDIRPADASWRCYLTTDMMLSLFGAQPGFTDRFDDIRLLGSIPFVELGAEIFNPNGAAFTLFARGEWQRDAGIHATPERGRLAEFGVRISTVDGMW